VDKIGVILARRLLRVAAVRRGENCSEARDEGATLQRYDLPTGRC
jgi:hypothetical protein